MHPPKLKKAAETPRFEVVRLVVNPLWKAVGISECPHEHDQALPHADQHVMSPLSHQMHAPGCESGDETKHRRNAATRRRWKWRLEITEKGS
jgi:hypothetical protein